MELPYITFFTGENTATFWQFVTALLFVVFPLLLIWVATVYAGDLLSMLRRVFGGSSVDRKDDPKNYDIKFKD